MAGTSTGTDGGCVCRGEGTLAPLVCHACGCGEVCLDETWRTIDPLPPSLVAPARGKTGAATMLPPLADSDGCEGADACLAEAGKTIDPLRLSKEPLKAELLAASGQLGSATSSLGTDGGRDLGGGGKLLPRVGRRGDLATSACIAETGKTIDPVPSTQTPPAP